MSVASVLLLYVFLWDFRLRFRNIMNGEDSAVSALSNTAVGIREGSDSNDTSLVCAPPAAKRQRTQHVPADSDRFKGVVLQHNGHWGAQIYADHRRVWLGTFKSEELAAIAYDRAASKLRHDDSPRNFPGLSAYEPMFQHMHDVDVVLKMIKDGSYDAKFAEYIHATAGRSGEDRADDGSAGGVVIHELFQKELTPSDVGKLNRLVIPKKHAVTYFPPIQVSSNKDEGSGGGQDGDGDGTEGMMLEFRDRQGRRWEFRYSYWRSSQSYVFTKGWNKFVKNKELSAKDTVVFYRCEDRGGAGRAFCMIDVVFTSRDGDDGSAGGFGPGLGLGLGMGMGVGVEERGKLAEEEEEVLVKPAVVEEQGPRKGFKLFGVYISC